jgi:hypothetical protein
MATATGDAATSVALTELSERQRERALDRYKKLRPHLERDIPLAGVAKEASLPLRTAQRWVSRYRRFGLIGLIRDGRRIRANGGGFHTTFAALPKVLRWNVHRSAPAPFIGKSAASRALAANRRRDITRFTT